MAALRKRYSLTWLLKAAELPRSTYYYQLGVLAAGDRCASLKASIRTSLTGTEAAMAIGESPLRYVAKGSWLTVKGTPSDG